MTAKEARELASSFVEPIDGKSLAAVKAAIEKAAKKGEFHAFYYETVRSPVHKRLEEEGYELEEYYERNDYMLKIKW